MNERDSDRQLDEMLGALRAEDAGLEAPVHVETAVRAAFLAQSGKRPASAPKVWLAAAALVAGMAVALWWPGGSKRPIGAVPESAVESGTVYLPLRAGPVLAPGEIGRVIRVQVPRSAVASYGLPETVIVGSGPVQADVLIGLDGTARAVRFVQ